MKIVWLTLVTALIAWTPAHADEPTYDHWYQLAPDGEWCSYATQSDWDAAWETNGTYAGAWATFVDQQPSKISAQFTSETGDWLIYDDYGLEKGQIVSLERQYNSFPDGTISLLESYEAQRGKLVRTTRRLTPMAKFDQDLPEDPEIQIPFPPVERVEDFGFFAVLREKPESGAICR